MSGTLISTGITKVEKGQRGFISLELSEIYPLGISVLEPEILQGSVIEIGGAMYEFQASTESITGWSGITTSTVAFIEIQPSASAPYPAVAAWSSTSPTWDTGNQAWYNGTNRTIGYCWKDSATGWHFKHFLTKQNHEDGDVLRFDVITPEVGDIIGDVTSTVQSFYVSTLANYVGTILPDTAATTIHDVRGWVRRLGVVSHCKEFVQEGGIDRWQLRTYDVSAGAVSDVQIRYDSVPGNANVGYANFWWYHEMP